MELCIYLTYLKSDEFILEIWLIVYIHKFVYFITNIKYLQVKEYKI